MKELKKGGKCKNGESMGKLRKAVSHWGWIVIEPLRAVAMASEGQIGHCTAEVASSNGAGFARLREDMGNPHYAAWLKVCILPSAKCGNSHHNTEHLGDVVEAMLGLSF